MLPTISLCVVRMLVFFFSAFRKRRNNATKTLKIAKFAYFDNLFVIDKRSEVLRRKLNSLYKLGSCVDKITEIENWRHRGVAWAEKFNQYFVNLVQSIHCEDASCRLMIRVHDSQYCSVPPLTGRLFRGLDVRFLCSLTSNIRREHPNGVVHVLVATFLASK